MKDRLSVILADLHNVAGWAAFDFHQDNTARYHFAQAMTFGNSGDGFQYAVSSSVRRWGETTDRRQAVLGRITLAQLHVQTGDSLSTSSDYRGE